MTITPPEHRTFSSEALSRKVSGRSGAMLIGVADIDGLGGAENVQAALEAITGIIGSGTDHDHGDLYVTAADLAALLDEKADSDHTHPAASSSAAGFMTASQFTKLAGIETGATADMTAAEIFAALATYRGAASGLASLDSSGLVPEAQIPAVAITDTFEVASQTAMLALTVQRGDVAVRSDLNKSFILRATPASTLSNWSELRTPTDAVLSVFGRFGAVGATAGDYSAAQITNTPAGSIAATTVQAALNELDSEKQAISARNQVSGYAGLNASGFVDPAQLGSGTRDSTTILFGDGTFKTAPAGGGGGSMTDQQILDAIKRVDSSGSGIDADLLDGLSASDFLLASSRAAANGVAPLGADSLIPEAYIPAVAITDTFEVSSQAAMLALTAQRGDVAIRSDINKSFVLRATPASTLSNWSELRTPTDAVLSVNGMTGAVTIPTATESAIGLAELATTAEVQAGTDTVRIVTPAGLSARAATESRTGVAEIATQAEVQAGTDDSRFVTPLKHAAYLPRARGAFKAYKSADQIVSRVSGTNEKILWGATAFDVEGAFSTANSRFVVPTGMAGIWYLRVEYQVTGNLDGSALVAQITVNGTTADSEAYHTASTRNIGISCTGQFQLAAGDVIETRMNVANVGGTTGDYTIVSGTVSSNFEGRFMGTI